MGHIVGKEGMSADPEKTRAVKEMAVPKEPKAVSRFLGMAGFYRKYIQNFAARSSNLRELLKKDKEFVWTKECQDEFEDIKIALTTSPVMVYPNFNKKFILSTDASYQGVGATLSQNGEGGERVISYASRSLNVHEKNYGVTKLEALGVVWATNLYKVYLQDHKFDLITDHKALLKFKEMKDTNPTLERWSIKLSQYDFDVIYREGRLHENVDCLSRDPIDVIGIKKKTSIMAISDEDRNHEFIEAQKNDERLNGLRNQILMHGIVTFNREGDIEEREIRRKYDAMVLKRDGRLYKRSYRKSNPVDYM